MLRLFPLFFLFCILVVPARAQRGLTVDAYGGGLSEQLVGDSGKRKVALVVGVSNYSSESLRLKYADRDARLFRDYLSAVRGFPGSNVFFLPDSTATAGKIYNLIQSLLRALVSGDELVIYFAGHGDVQTVDDFSEAFLLAWDASGSRNYKGAGGVVDLEDLQRYTNHLSTRKKVQVTLVLDACHSGFDLYKDGILRAQQTISEQFSSVNKWTGCAVNELSYEADSLKHGLFTWYLVQGLMGLADDPIDNAITPSELDRFVKGKVAQASFGKQNPQLGMVSDFRYAVTPADREKALSYFRNRQFNQSFASRGLGAPADTGSTRDWKPFIERYNRFLQQEKFYGGDSSALSVIASVEPLPGSASLVRGLRDHLAEVLETRSQLVLNEFLKGKSQLPRSNRFYQAGVESALADSLLEQDDPRRKTNQVMSAFHKSYSYIRYEQFEKYKEAEGLLRAAITLEPKAAYLYVALTQLLQQRAQYDSAIYYANKAASIIPTWTHPQNQLGNQYEALYRYDEAIRQFEQTLRIDSQYSWSYNNIGLAYKNMGRLTEAERYFSRSLELKDRAGLESIERDLAISYNNLGAIYDDRKQFTRAESYYRQALAIDSTFTLPLQNLSSLYSSYDGAEAEFLLKKAIGLMPFEAENYRLLANFYCDYPSRVGILDSAARLYQTAMELDPYDPGSYIGMANLVRDAGRPDSGLYWLRKGLRWAARNPDMQYGIAMYFEEVGRSDSADHYYRTALQLNPYDFYISDRYADFLLQQRDTLGAERVLLSQRERLSQTPIYFYQLGDFFYRVGRVPAAVEAYERVVAIDSLYEPAWEALAYLYLELGLSKESLRALDRLKPLDGYAAVQIAFLHRVGELSWKREGLTRTQWLETYAVVDPTSQYLSALRLQSLYPSGPGLRKAFLAGWALLDAAESYEAEWLKWMLLASIELSDTKRAVQLAALYLESVFIPEQDIRSVALWLTGDRSAASRIKRSNTDPLGGYGPAFKKIYNAL